MPKKYSVIWDKNNSLCKANGFYKPKNLPDIVEVPDYIDNKNYSLVDYLYSRYGWLIKSFNLLN